MLIFHCIALLSSWDSVEHRCYQRVVLFCFMLYWNSWFATPACLLYFQKRNFHQMCWPLNLMLGLVSVFCKILSRIMSLQQACFSGSGWNPVRMLFSFIYLLEIPVPTWLAQIEDLHVFTIFVFCVNFLY